MRKSILFRSLTVFLAAATLLSSTSAYNLLVYANQELVSSSLSATGDEQAYEPNITVQGGELQLETNAEGDPETDAISWGTDANGNPADGSQQNPYQISSLEHFLQVNEMVNDSTGSVVANPVNKYFVLTADIDLSSLTAADFINYTGSAYFVSTDHKNPNSSQVYIHLDGSYVDENGKTQRHKITGGNSGWNIEISGHQNVAIFGYLSENSVIQNVIFENININATVANPRQIAIIANKNDGVIQNCSVNNCSVTSALGTNHTDPYYITDGVNFYNGVAAAVTDNGGTLKDVSVNDIAITLKGEDDYIGAVVAQNRGLVDGCSVSGIKVAANTNNHYIGGIAGYNEPDSVSQGVQNCQVDMPGANGTMQNFTKGAYVGGLVGSNDGYIYNSSVTGSYPSYKNPTANAYNMLGNVTYSSGDITYYGGAAGISTGEIVNVTVSDVGFYFTANTSARRVYYGGITSTVSKASSISNCVSTGSFASDSDANVYAGGVIGYAAADIADGAIVNTYTLYHIDNPTKAHVGAVIGWGGKATTLSGCYWSDQVSGCSTSYVQTDAVHTDLIAGADAVTGNLVSSNKAMVAVRNIATTIDRNTLTHSWAGSGVTFSLPEADVTAPTNVVNNSLAKAPYTVTAKFPAGIGASDKSDLDVGFNVDVFVTTALGDPDNASDPMIISSSAQAKYIYLAPYGHYKLNQNISVSSSASWEAPVFTGTLDGNGKTITTDTKLFAAVIGNRAGDIGSALDTTVYATNPANDNAAYLKNGYVKELNVDLSENITSAVFGDIINATFVNVALTDGDIAEDDGNEATFDGFYATFTSKRQATFASSANGYSYIYGCSTNVSAYIREDGQGISYNDQAIFIAKLTGETTVDNCYINASIYVCAGLTANTGRAAFIGDISENTGYILNSAINTRVVNYVSGLSPSHCTVIFGKMDNITNNYGKYKNLVWSKSEPTAVLYPSSQNYDNSQIILWGSHATAGGTAYPEKTIAQGVSTSFSINVPQNIKAFTDTRVSDFLVSADEGDESAIEVLSVSLDENVISFTIRAKADATIDSREYIRIYHQPSGLTTFVRIVIKESGLTYNEEDGFYHITTATDIKFIADNFAKPDGRGKTYAQAAYILDNDIDMTDVTISPIGTASIPFTGIFTGPTDENGEPLYTIYNLKVESQSSNSALFGAADFSGADMVLGKDSVSYERGISNIAVTGATVSGADNVAVLVGYAFDSNTNDKIYGKTSIKNIVVTDSVVTAGAVGSNSGKSAAAVLAYAYDTDLNITDIKVERVCVESYYYTSTPYYFVAERDSSNNKSGGLGGVVGVIQEYQRGNKFENAMTVNIYDVDILGLELNGTDITGTKTYAPLNAGGVVGVYFTQYTANTTVYATLNIGAPDYAGEGYDINVEDSVIMVSGNAGGVIGATNVKTTVNSARVYGSKSPVGAEDDAVIPMQIHAKTDYFVGGIAGYIGSKVRDDVNTSDSYDNASFSNVYGTVKNCLVENVDVRAIATSTEQLTRNVTVGGIVGAINGHKDSNAVYNSAVKNSHVEGIVVGGIVGSGIDTNGSLEEDIFPNNSINIDSCSVIGSRIRTLANIIPATEAWDGWLAYGVGGILGTNKRNIYNYAQHTSIQRCIVDENTSIINTIPRSASGTTDTFHSVTGGILGAGFENALDAGPLVVKYNEVYASIVSENNIPISNVAPDQANAVYNALSATGGIVGSFIGIQYRTYAPLASDAELCELSTTSIQHCVFGGSIVGTDGIGGAIGVISAASAYSDDPSNLLSDIVITGKLKSVLDNTVYRGGIVVGHIAIKSNGIDSSDDSTYYAFDAAVGTDITPIFNKIYFSTFGIDTSYFPVFGYNNATNAINSADYSPLASNAQAMLIECYEDVNKRDDNLTIQFSSVESATDYTLPLELYPATTRPTNMDGAFTVNNQKWYGSNSTIAEVVSAGPNDLTVRPLNSGTISVMIDYVGTVGDETWSILVHLPVGFRFKSNNQTPLDSVTVGGKTYYLITNPYDLAILGKNMTDADNMGNIDAAHMSLNYWITNDIVLSEEMFETDGFYDGGFTPVGTSSIPFTGTLASMPAGQTYTSAAGKEYVSDGNNTITGMQLAPATHMGLFAYVKGATFENFAVDDFTAKGTDETVYLGTLAAVVSNNVTVNNVTLSNINLTDSDYTGGFLGGVLYADNTAESELTNVSVIGSVNDDTYSNIIRAHYGAAGIVAHTSHYNTNLINIAVQDVLITQEADVDSDTFDYGAAGIAMAYSGKISASPGFRNKVEECEIVGEIAAGVVTRTYTSTSANSFINKTSLTLSASNPSFRATDFELTSIDIKSLTITGNHSVSSVIDNMSFAASGGILARADAIYVNHIIKDCILDSETYVKAKFGAGGMVGCFETPYSDSRNYGIHLPYYMCIDSCESQATVEITSKDAKVKVNSSIPNIGAGAVIGYIGLYTSFVEMNVKNTVASGKVRGYGCIGALVGAIYSENYYQLPEDASNHFFENCVISTKLECFDDNGLYVSAFDKNVYGVGIVVGHVACLTTSEDIFEGAVEYYEGEDNYPFYNIYITDAYYRDEFNVRLFGISGDGVYGDKEISLSDYPIYTDYTYNLNRKDVFSIDRENKTYVLTFSDDTNRISVVGNEGADKHTFKLNYNTIQTGNGKISTSRFLFDSSVIDIDNFVFDSAASINGFTVTADAAKGAVVSAGAESTEFVLESITSSDSRITISPVDGSATEYSVTSAPLTSGVSGQLYFHYTNGLTLSVGLEVEIKPEDFWFKVREDGVEDLLIFNAANLSFVKNRASATSVITQCYDVYWTLSDSAVIAAASAAIEGKKLSDVYSAEFITALADYKHPNPFYDGTDATELYVTFDEMFNKDAATRGDIMLSELVGEIGNTSFEAYGEDAGASVYSRSDAFTGTYKVETAKVASGLTDAGDTYKIYGFELRSNNVTANDVAYTGMFNRIGAGATVSNVTFVNPVINTVNSQAASNYVGVLAGDITGATVEDITVTEMNGNSYVSSVRRMTAANTYVGAVAGYIGAGTTVNGVNISGVDVIGASTAGNRASNANAIKFVYAGGVVGASDGILNNVWVDNVNVFANRNESYARGYISYAGGVAGKASGKISGKDISVLVSGCDITVNIDENDSATVEYTANPSSEAGDRLGGVVGLASGSLDISGANLKKIQVNAFDVAGGVIAEIVNDASVTVNVTGCDIGSDENKASVTMTGTSNITGKTYERVFYNAVGGVVGFTDNVAMLKITDCDFNGFVGQYELEHKNSTAGGIIGLVGENLASLDSIVIGTSTVQGEVAGYRRAALSESASLRILGAAGGIIGKIYNFAYKTFSNTDKMISDSVMSARVNLYNSINGTTVKADYATLENIYSDPNVGKIIGELRAGDNFAYTAGSADTNNVLFTNYISNVYISSYPQNIVAYGSSAFYNNAVNDPKTTYIDINKENRYMSSEAEGPEDVSSFMVDSTIASSTDEPDDYNTGTYSDVAIITFDENSSQQGTVSSRYFRLAYDNIKLNENVDKTIEFSEQFAISVEDSSIDLNDVTVIANFYDKKSLTETVDSTHSYTYHPGVITLTSNKNVDIVGYISAKYNYGLEAGIQFVSMEIAGNGTEANPFEVKQPKHFKVVRALRGAYYKQVANIDFADPLNNQYSSATPGALFAGGKGIEPIGQSSAPFTGSYDGDGFILSNVYIARPDEDNVGFFGYIGTGNNRATLKNIHIELAGEMDIADENSVVTTVVGGITGKETVGGLVGYANNAEITNCSVADGFVMGKTKVGGLVGRAGSVDFNSCYTATSTYSYLEATGSGLTKSAGALAGNTTGTVSISKSFTLGLASVGTTSTSGVAGGLVGYVGSGTLSIGDSLVGATVSNYDSIKDSDNVTYTGMTVGQAASSANVAAANVIVAATSALAISDNKVVNPVLGGNVGASVTNIYVDTDLAGIPNGTEACTKVEKDTEGYYKFSVSQEAAADEYTAAYVALAVIPVTVEANEVKDRDTYKNPGLYYPVSLGHGGGYTFTTSVIDLTDTVAYPDGLDEELYGNVTAGGNDKNTDLLFRDDNGVTTVYPNVFSKIQGEVLSDGSVHENGEVAYDSTMPYFNVSKSITVNGSEIEITRKIVYPQQSRTSTRISTARQFFALTNKAENVSGSKFYDFYTLNGKSATLYGNYTVVADIDLGANNFTPIVGYKGVFDGNGYTVDNLVINMPGNNEVGLFRTLSNATVKNLTLGVNQITGANNVGGLVGAIITEESESITFNAMVQIENCHVVQSEGGSGIKATGKNVGGLVGAATRSLANSDTYLINNSSSSANVSGYDVVGGLVGYCEQPVRNSYSTGSVEAQITSGSTVTEIHPWYVSGTTVVTAAPFESSAQHGVGGLVGVLCNSTSTNNVAPAEVSYSFGSGIVTVKDAACAQGSVYGVGGLVGVSCTGTTVDTSFSSGNVYYCYGNEALASCNGITVGVGGLVGVNYSELNNVYSSASVAADFGDVTSATAVGAGGVVGVAYAKISSSYSSGATLSTTTTADYSNCNYGMGGVIGILDYAAEECANLIFDLNLSITDKVAGKILNGKIQENNSGARTTKQLTSETGFMSFDFGYVKGAYPYLTNFFKNNVSLVIRINALLSIVALQLNELDTSAASGNGISMALNIPTEFNYIASGTDDSDNAGVYAYGYSDENSLVDAAQGVIDTVTNTLSIQRTVNEAQYVNFVITVASKDNSTVSADGTEYSKVANRLVSRLCAPMLGTDTHPYLVATQEDLRHVGMTSTELQSATGMYKQWATPILENGTATLGKVNFRLMGYVPLDGYNRTIADLTGQTYSVDGKTIAYEGITFDGNGYSIRNLQTRLFSKLDSSSKLSNMTFEDTAFKSTSLIGSLEGTVDGVNIFGTASGSNTAAIANAVASGGKIIGSLANLDYDGGTEAVSNIAGLAITNNGDIRMSASVGNFSGSEVSGLGGLVVENNGTILDSFTIGNIIFTGDATNLGGFVNNNTGSITNCYTRCNIDIAANTAERIIASFAAQNSGTIKSAYSSGMLKLGVKTNPYSVFVASSTGTLTDCMFDKQMSGSQFSEIHTLAERTLDIVKLTNHTGMISTNTLSAYECVTPEIDAANNIYHNVYYPQLTSILNTEEYEKMGEGDDTTKVETVRSRMYSALRAYSFISSATALVGNDNYIDNLAYDSKTPLSYDETKDTNRNLWSRTSGSDIASVTFYGTGGSDVYGRHILAGENPNNPDASTNAVISAKYAVNSFYGLKLDDAQLDLFVKVTDGAHPNFAGGDGTADNPYVINTDKQFVGLSFYGTNPDGHFILGNDIDMSNAVWTNYLDNFKADLDGDNKALYNVTIGESGNDSLFGMINGGKIDSLGVAGIDVAVTGSSGGMLASSATNGASITNTYVVGTLNTSNDSAQTNIGGLVGEIDGSVIDGCVVSGKIVSDASCTGGVVGSALDGSKVCNTLSTVYVDGGEGTAAGVVGTVSGAVEIKSCVFASDVKGAIKGNIVGDGSAGDNCYYDKQMSSVVDNANGVSTHYLTGGATIKQLGFVDGENETMAKLDGFAGYPVPVGMASSNGKFLAGLKFASAKISLASGAGAGTLNSFTSITAPSTLDTGVSAKLSFSVGEGETAYLTNVSDTQINTDTATLALGEIVNRNVAYKLADGGFDGGKMVRYLDLYVGKTLKVTYNYVGLDSNANAVLTAYSGMSNVSAVTAFAVSGKHNDVLCNSMVVPYDAEQGAYILRIASELPQDKVINTVSATVNLDGSASNDITVNEERLADGIWKLAFEPKKSANGETIPVDCDEIIITVNLADAPWGIHQYLNLF